MYTSKKCPEYLLIPFRSLIFISVVPRVELSLGRMVNPEDLEEGDDIYFSCSIRANPPAYKITWWHNVSENNAIDI